MEIAKTMPLLDCDRVFNVEMKVTQQLNMNLLQIRREMPSCRCPLYTAQSQRMYRVQTSSNFSFGLECVKLSLPLSWWLTRTAMKLEEEGLKNACGTWTMLAFYVPGAQNCINTTTKSSAVWIVNFAFCRTAGIHGPRMGAGGHIACCFMLRLPVWYQSIQVVQVFLIEMCFGCNSNSAFGNGRDEV